MREQTVKDLVVFLLLVAIGVVGRWLQPDWAISPIAACGLLAGFYFTRTGVAMFVPLLAMLLSDIALPGYQFFGVMLAVYAAMACSVLLGRWLQKGQGARWLAKLGVSAIAPATLFFLLSNLAVWALQPMYEKSLAGLVACYGAAVPFYGRMLLGDIAYTGLLFTAAAAAATFAGVAWRRTGNC